MAEAFLESIGTAELLPQEYQRGYNVGYTAGRNSMSGEYQRGYNAGYAAGQSSATVIIRQSMFYPTETIQLPAIVGKTVVTVSKSTVRCHFGNWQVWDVHSMSLGSASISTTPLDVTVTQSSPSSSKWGGGYMSGLFWVKLNGSTLEMYWEVNRGDNPTTRSRFYYDVVIY